MRLLGNNLVDIFIPGDFWHGKRKVGTRFVAGELGGYYNDLTYKTAAFPGPKSTLGIPLVNLGNNSYALHPVTVCQAALGWFERWLAEGQDSAQERFLELADWLVEHQENRETVGGVWPIPYSIPIYNLTKGWISALVQGQAISALVRAHRISGNSTYFDAANQALNPLSVDVNDGGVAGHDSSGGIYFEEYPTNPSSRVLNGFISALWGLYDHHIWTDDICSGDLFEQGMNTLISSLSLYDVGYWSRYSLFKQPNFSNLASPYYHQEHIAQLRATYMLVSEESLLQTAERWENYAQNSLYVARVILEKIFFRLKGYIVRQRISEK